MKVTPTRVCYGIRKLANQKRSLPLNLSLRSGFMTSDWLTCLWRAGLRGEGHRMEGSLIELAIELTDAGYTNQKLSF